MSGKLDATQVVAWINEFYTTMDHDRRHELDSLLCKVKTEFECGETIAACILMINSPSSSANVRYFGIMSLYDIIRERQNECISNLKNMECLKAFFIETLTNGAHMQTQSVTNKLSSTLALLALYCIPDIWPEPVAELTNIWAGSPELLLRVLSEMAAEFSNVMMPLAQRSVLKTHLHRISEDIIKIIWTVLSAGDASPSTRQAAVECVEQWVRLPGVALQQWSDVLSIVFAAVSEDCAALTNLFDILSENDELSNMHQLIMDICEYITTKVSQKVAEELRFDGCSEEACSLVSAMCCLAEKAVPTLVQNALQASNVQLRDVVMVMHALSTWEGRYPVDERISDLPAVFWTTLREEMSASLASTKRCDENMVASISQVFAENVHSAVTKMAFVPENELAKYTHEEREFFNNYRKSRSEVSIDAYHLAGNRILGYLNSELASTIEARDVNRCESVLYLWENVANYLNEGDMSHIFRCMELVTMLSLEDERIDVDVERRGNTLMRLFYALSHLIQESDQCVQLEMAVFPLVLSHVDRLPDALEALITLEKFVEERTETIDVMGEGLSQTCYTFFMNEYKPRKQRLTALKCIGHILSKKSPQEVMGIVGQILDAHVRNVDNLDGLSEEQVMARYSFKISIFSALFTSLNVKQKGASSDVEPAIVQILREAMPVLERIASQAVAGRLVDDVCDAVRSGMCALPDDCVPQFFAFVVRLLDGALLSNAASACGLAKSTVLLCGKSAGTDFCDAVCRWFGMFEQRLNDSQLDEWLGLIYQVVKKDWKTLRVHGDRSLPAFENAVNISAYTILNSQDPGVVKVASQILATIATQITLNDDVQIRNLLAVNGPVLVTAIFQRIQRELMRQSVDSLAEVLFFFIKQFPTETRAVISGEEYGDSPLVAAMFREVGNLRNFKQMTLRLNLAAVKDLACK